MLQSSHAAVVFEVFVCTVLQKQLHQIGFIKHCCKNQSRSSHAVDDVNIGSGFYQLLKADPTPGAPGAGATAIATLAAFGVGFLVIIAFLKIVSTYSYMPFVVYRIVLAVLVVLGVVAGLLDPEGAAATAPVP